MGLWLASRKVTLCNDSAWVRPGTGVAVASHERKAKKKHTIAMFVSALWTASFGKE
jgi:hypothetical protein